MPKHRTFTRASPVFGVGLGVSALMKRALAGPVPLWMSAECVSRFTCRILDREGCRKGKGGEGETRSNTDGPHFLRHSKYNLKPEEEIQKG